MNDLQKKLLEMFEWLTQFLNRHGLKYYALGGTMLGAARHNGFIPWDDDIDIAMPREDYNRLAECMQKENQSRFELETPDTKAKDFFYSFAKLYDTTTTLIENNKYKIKRGISIDIFPLDGIGNSREESFKNYKKITKAQNLLLLRTSGVRKGRSFIKNLGVLLFRLIPLNSKKLLKKLDRLCSKYSWQQCSWGGNLVGAWRFKEVMPKEIMGEPTLYQFEHLQICGAQDYDGYLTSLYGDWRKLPPEEKRVSHHDFLLLDLNKSYKE